MGSQKRLEEKRGKIVGVKKDVREKLIDILPINCTENTKVFSSTIHEIPPQNSDLDLGESQRRSRS